jgi:hypothetical protein
MRIFGEPGSKLLPFGVQLNVLFARGFSVDQLSLTWHFHIHGDA